MARRLPNSGRRLVFDAWPCGRGHEAGIASGKYHMLRHRVIVPEEGWMAESDKDRPTREQKPKADEKKVEVVEWPFSPSNPPDLHARPLIRSRIDNEGLRKALERVGVIPD